MSGWRSKAIGLLIVSCTTGAGAVMVTSNATGATNTAALRSEALAASPSMSRDSGSRYTPAAARAQADRATGTVPLPPGGNVNGIEWERAGGLFGAYEVEAVVEYNAFCQWLRAAQAEASRQTALDVLDDVPSWPAFRDQGDLDVIRQVIAEAGAGGGGTHDVVLADCLRAHEQERAYAQEQGLTPSQ